MESLLVQLCAFYMIVTPLCKSCILKLQLKQILLCQRRPNNKKFEILLVPEIIFLKLYLIHASEFCYKIIIILISIYLTMLHIPVTNK